MKSVLILLSEGFEAYEASAFTDVLGWADSFGDTRLKVITAALRPVLKCTFGLRVMPDALVKDLDLETFDALAIPGGFGTAGFYEDAFSEDFLRVIRYFDEEKKPIASVCVASLSLGLSGVLTGRCATTYLLEERKKEQLARMGAKVEEKPIVQDGNIITSSSPGTAAETAFLLLEVLSSPENANHIRRLMGFG
jgi:protein deglycase